MANLWLSPYAWMVKVRGMNPAILGLLGTLLAGLLVVVFMQVPKLPLLRPTASYVVQFADAAGLKSGDDVRVLGVPVGKVGDIRVQGDHVAADVTVDDHVQLGSATGASIEVATVLGNEFVQLDSSGSGRLRPGGTIPVARTTVPYTLLTAFGAFAQFSNGVDLPQLSDSLHQLSSAISAVPSDSAKTALDGIASMAATFAGREGEVRQILTSVASITSTLNQNSEALTELLGQGDQFLQLMQRRSAVIDSLLRDTATLGAELQTLISTNGVKLSGLLANVKTISGVLADQHAQLQQALNVLGKFSVNITNITGSGSWLDLFVPAGVQPDNQINLCGTQPNSTNRPCGD